MIKRILSLALVLICMGACASGEEVIMNIIQDPGFVNGATVISPSKPMRMVGRIRLSEEGSNQPDWLLTQWNSRNNIMRIPLVIDENGAYVYKNEFKTVSRDPDGTLTLRVNGGEEYVRTRTSLLDSWVHLYFEQRYLDYTPLAGTKNANLTLSFSIPHFEDRTPAGELNPNLHAVIAVFYLTLADDNPESPCYGQFINFCVMLYDNRTGITREETHMDSGQNPIDATNMIVYTMNSAEYASPVHADGEWHDVDIDLLPFFKRSLELAHKGGCMTSTKFEDLAIRSVFFGFEVPGVMDCEMKIRHPQLTLIKEAEK